jgi:hypothetical protein
MTEPNDHTRGELPEPNHGFMTVDPKKHAAMVETSRAATPHVAHPENLPTDYQRGAEDALRRAFELAKQHPENPIRGIIVAADEFGVTL